MNTSGHNDSDIYQAPAADIVGEAGGYDESSMFSPGGRAGRLRYLGYSIGFTFLASFSMGLLSLIIAAIGERSNSALALISVIPLLVYIAILMVTIIFMIKRLHDLNWSGWISLLSAIPLVNLLLGLILIFAPGNSGPNKYGPPPKPESNALVIIIFIFVFVAVVGILAAIAIPAYNDYANRAQQVQQTQ